jgi:hypothetical protein
MLAEALLMTIAAAPLPTQDWVDLARYAGRWYEIARLPNRFQEQCAGDVAASYTLRPDGRGPVNGAGGGTARAARGRWPACRRRSLSRLRCRPLACPSFPAVRRLPSIGSAPTVATRC